MSKRLSSLGVGDIIYLLHRQYSSDDTPPPPFPCAVDSGGGLDCAHQLCEELVRRGVHPELAEELRYVIELQRDTYNRVLLAQDMVHRQVQMARGQKSSEDLAA